MPSKFLVKRSSVKGKRPGSGDLEVAELAINFPDRKIYTKDPGGNIIELGATGAAARRAITPFDRTKSYVADDLVIYQDEIYRCITAQANTNWTAANFEPIEVMPKPPAGVSQSITAADKADVPLTLRGAAGQATDLFKAGIFSLRFSGAPSILNTVPNNPALVIDPAPGQTVPLVTVNNQPFIDKAGKLTPQSGAVIQNPPAGTSQSITAADKADVPLTLKSAAATTVDDLIINRSDNSPLLGAGRGRLIVTRSGLTGPIDATRDFSALFENGGIRSNRSWGKVELNAEPMGGVLSVTPYDPAKIGCTIKGAAGQTANLLQVDTNKLVVEANGRMRTNATAFGIWEAQRNGAKVFSVGAGGTGNVMMDSKGVLQFAINGAEKARLTANGNFAVGVIAPTATTHIKNSQDQVALKVDGAAGQTGDLQQWSDDTGTVLSTVAKNGRITARLSGAAAASPRGSVNAYNTMALTQGPADSSALYFWDKANAKIEAGIRQDITVFGLSTADRSITFSCGPPNAAQALLDVPERMRITADGKVGIGTNAPSAQTHIKSGAAATVGLKVDPATGQTADLIQASDFRVLPDSSMRIATATSRIDAKPDGSLWVWDTSVPANQRRTILNRPGAGQPAVLVDCAPPASSCVDLRVPDVTTKTADFLRCFDMKTSSPVCTIAPSGAIHSTSTTITPITSDKRMKKVTSKLDDALDVVNQLNPIRYAWKKGYGEGEQYGFIAQEVGKVKPDALLDAEHEKLKDAKTYNPEFLVPYLVKAVQQLTAQVEELKTQLEAK